MTETSKPAVARRARKNVATRDSEATQARIFEAAKMLFSQNTYEGVGLREIAANAGVDPALVMRYFGSKEGLFRAVASQAFGAHDFLRHGVESLPGEAARVLTSTLDHDQWRLGYDPLRLLLCSIGSTTAGPIVSEYLCDDFIAPITEALRGNHRSERAMMLASSVVGFALIRLALASANGYALKQRPLRELLVDTLAALVDDGKTKGSGRA
jgi:AcrR family transcriptional regulator